MERIQRLEALGFVWNATELQGDVRMAELRAFRREHGHCRLPRSHANKALASFVNRLRVLKRAKQIDPAREAELEEMGFEWKPHSADWEQFYSELAAFREAHGHCNPSCREGGQARLYHWVVRQRNRRDSMAEERRLRLEALGFAWWEEGFDAAKAA